MFSSGNPRGSGEKGGGDVKKEGPGEAREARTKEKIQGSAVCARGAIGRGKWEGREAAQDGSWFPLVSQIDRGWGAFQSGTEQG